MMQALAEATARFERLGEGEQHLEGEHFDLFMAPGDDARSCLVQRPRFDAAGIGATVEQARSLMRAQGRHAATWELLGSAHPPATIEQLLSLGMCRADPSLAVIMALSSAPTAGDPQVRVSEVNTLDEFGVHLAITHEVFDALDRLPAELARLAEDGEQRLADRSFVRYVARVGGVPAGAATATFTPAGVMLHSGSTLSRFRGRGVYAAMVSHRWQAAVARGTPELITRAGPMSRAILGRLGFRELGEIHFLIDRFA